MDGTHSLAGLMKWMRRDEWRDPFNELLTLHIGSACADAGVQVEKLDDLLGNRHSDILWGCVFEDFLTIERDEGRNIVDDYLKRRGWKEGAGNRAYMAALRSSVMSLYEVSGIVSDESFLARDLLRGGEPVKVNERSGTRYLKSWDRIAARLVHVGSRVEIAGGVLPFDHDASNELIEALTRAGKPTGRRSRKSRSAAEPAGNPSAAGPLVDADLLRRSAFVFTNTWLADRLRRILHPQLPQLRNTDGEEIEFTTVRYPLSRRASAEAIVRALDVLPSLQPESRTFWNWIERREDVRGKPVAASCAIVTELGGGATVLGNIELKGKTLVLETNSRARTQKGRAVIEPALRGLVGAPVITVRDVAELMTSRRSGDELDTEKLSLGNDSDEERRIIHAYLDNYYTKLLDQPVPMLGNISPRRASKTAKGREKLVAWLKLMENSAAKGEAANPMASYDFAWLWQTLDVAHLRR